jgi:peptidyl-prolyl cis-trans isomerase D
MATLEKIRTKAGLLITIIIGLALLAFVLGDFLSPGRSLLSRTRLQIGKVYGQSLSVVQFQKRLAEMEETYKKRNKSTSIDETTMNQIIDQTWTMMIDELLMEKEYKNLGIAISDEELKDITIGKNKNQQIKEAFTDPKTGQFRMDYLKQYISQNKEEWISFEDQLKLQKCLEKYNTLLLKSLYTTTLEARMDSAENTRKVGFRFIVASYNSISDSAVLLTDNDYSSYLKKHEKEYEQEASRNLEYVVFPILPSKTDYLQTENFIISLKPEFEQIDTAEIKRYVNLNSDTRFDEKYYKQDEFPSDTVKKSLFNSKVGAVIGPVFESNAYKLYRLVNTKELPDSVKARHILIPLQEQTQLAYDNAKKLADSLKKMVESDKGASFAELATKYSQDPGSAQKGGDLGFFKEGAMVKQFNDFCFFGKKGDIGVVFSQFGFHIIQIQELGKLIRKDQIATLDKKMIASNATRDSVYKQANTFASTSNTAELFDANIIKTGLEKKTAMALHQNEKNIAGLNNPKKVVYWAFDAKPGEVSKAIDLEDQWVIAKLTKALKDGVPSWTEIKDQMQPIVLKEKKFEQLSADMKSKMANVKSLEELADQMKTPVQVASNISFSSYALPSGYEPAVIGVASVIKEKTLSTPIMGMSGAYVVVVDSVSKAYAGTVAMSKDNLSRMNSYSLYNYSFLQTLRKIANVKDERFRFNY